MSEKEERSFGDMETLRDGRSGAGSEGERSFGDRETLRDGEGWGIEEGWGGKRWKAGEEILGRYVVETELGQGGMGVVYACLDKVGGVRVAVKALPPEVGWNRDEMEDIRENFQLVSGLRHPNIVGVRTLEKDERGEYFLVMDLSGGESLRRWMRRKWREGGLSLAEAIPILRQVAGALDYAHKMRVVHRDVKPGNVMVDETGEVKVLDFGLAAQIRSSVSRVSQERGRTSGTWAYMAPEQWEGRRQDAKADQYALGAVAYEMLAGRLPFEGDDAEVLRSAVLKGEVEDIEGVGAGTMAALRRAMAKRKEERFESCGEFVETLVEINTETQRAQDKWKGGEYGGCEKSSRRNDSDAISEKAEKRTGQASWFKISTAKFAQALKKTIKIAGILLGILLVIALVVFVLKKLGDKWKADRLAEQLSVAIAQSKKEVDQLGVGRKAGETKVIMLPNGVTMEMVWCPAGTFMMGSPEGEVGRGSDEIQHKVTLSKGFWVAKTEVTRRQWKSVMGSKRMKQLSSFYDDDVIPMADLFWSDCQDFCNNLGLQLPTEAQWEYACRAGSESSFGGTGNIDEMGWYGPSGIQPVGTKHANAWGLFDMHGNVWEWCSDWYGTYPSGAVTNPMGPTNGEKVVIRGGGRSSPAKNCRSAVRHEEYPSSCAPNLGFRPIRVET